MAKYKCPYCQSEECQVNDSLTIFGEENIIRINASCFNCHKNFILNVRGDLEREKHEQKKQEN